MQRRLWIATGPVQESARLAVRCRMQDEGHTQHERRKHKNLNTKAPRFHMRVNACYHSLMSTTIFGNH